MFKNIKASWELIYDAILAFKHYPVLLVPLLAFSALFSGLLVYIVFHMGSTELSKAMLWSIIALVFFVYSFGLAASCSTLVELVRHIESGEKPSLGSALHATFTKNLPGLLLLSLFWLIVEIICFIISALISSVMERLNKHKRITRFNQSLQQAIALQKATPQNIATLMMGLTGSGDPNDIDNYLAKLARMSVFLAIPSISWEKGTAFSPLKRAWKIGKSNFGMFLSGFVLSELIATIVFLPPLALFIAQNEGFVVPDFLWYLTIAYIVFGISCRLYLEQIFIAKLFLWHMKFEDAVATAKRDGNRVPSGIHEVARPKLMDDIAEFSNFQPKNSSTP